MSECFVGRSSLRGGVPSEAKAIFKALRKPKRVIATSLPERRLLRPGGYAACPRNDVLLSALSKHLNNRAVLLIEVLFSITLLAFGITACLRAMAQGLKIAQRSQEYYLAEQALDELMFRIESGADLPLFYDGGEGAFESPAVDLVDLRYRVESEKIEPPEEEESEEEAQAEERVIAGSQVEEKYRLIKASVTWRGGGESLDLFTIMREPDVPAKSA